MRSVLLWTCAALVVAAVLVAVLAPHGDLGVLIRRELASWGVFAVLALPLLATDEFVIRTAPSKVWQVVLFLVVGLAFVLVHHVASTLLGADTSMLGAGFVYVLILVLGAALRDRRSALQREVERAQLERQLAEARTQTLQSQLQPHFLFNTLQAISSSVESDPAQARRMIAALADLLRSTLRISEPLIPLGQDLALLEPYLALQHMRFGERLRVTIDVPAEVRNQPVPTLLLQPLVENAIRHGLEPRANGGELVITARPVDGCVEITVRDDGVGFDAAELRDGTGLRSARERLSTLFGPKATLHVEAAEPQGTCVRVVVPHR